MEMLKTMHRTTSVKIMPSRGTSSSLSLSNKLRLLKPRSITQENQQSRAPVVVNEAQGQQRGVKVPKVRRPMTVRTIAVTSSRIDLN